MRSRLNVRGRRGRPSRNGRHGAIGGDATISYQTISYLGAATVTLTTGGQALSPVTVEEGDFAIWSSFCALYAGVSGLTGWTQIFGHLGTNNGYRDVWYKRLTAGETAPAFTAGSTFRGARIWTFRGVAPTDEGGPFDMAYSIRQPGTAWPSASGPDITTITPGAMAVETVINNRYWTNYTVPTPNGWTKQDEYDSSGSGTQQATMAIATQAIPEAGVVAMPLWSATFLSDDRFVSMALRPAIA